MSDVINRTTLELLRSVNEPDYPLSDWIHQPDLSRVIGVDPQYWKIVGDSVLVMTAQEQAVINTNALPALKTIRLRGMRAAQEGFIVDAYSSYTLALFAALLADAVDPLNAKPNRATKIRQVLVYIRQLMVYLNQQMILVRNAADAAAVAAVPLNLAGAATDPNVTLPQILAIVN